MRRRISAILPVAALCMLVVLMAGCVTSGNDKPVQAEQPLLFPPLSAIKGGDYAAFRTENEEALKACLEPEKCALALFNLSFLHAYSKSPYYNPQRGLFYLEDLIKGAPESPWAYHARVWTDLIKKSAKTEHRKKSSREDVKSRETAAATEPEKQEETQQTSSEAPQASTEAQQDGGGAADRQKMEEQLRSRDEIIRELNRQLQRSRQIDIEIEKKERGLLY